MKKSMKLFFFSLLALLALIPRPAQSLEAYNSFTNMSALHADDEMAIYRIGTGMMNWTPIALDITDPASLASQTLTNPNLTSGTSWTATTDCALTASAGTCTFSAGTASTLSQASGTLAVAGVANRWYQYTYTISALSGTPAASITSAFASATTPLIMTAGTHTTYFKSAIAPGNFTITTTLTTGQAFTIDTLSLKQITGGNITAAGKFTGGGTSGLTITGAGAATFDSTVAATSFSGASTTQASGDTSTAIATDAFVAAAAPATVIVCGGTDDTSVISALLVDGANLKLRGTCKTTAITKSGITATLDMDPGAVLEPAGSSDIPILWQFTNSNITVKTFAINGLGLIERGMYFINGTFTSPQSNITLTNIGYPVDVADTTGAIGLYFNTVTNVQIGSVSGTAFQTVGNGACNTSTFQGSIRTLEFLNTGKVDIQYFYSDTGSIGNNLGEQVDYFQVNTGTEGGTIHHFVTRYNENTRRNFKIASGNWTIENIDVRPGTDFDAFSGSTQVGAYNLNAIDWSSNTTGSLDILSGYIDCTGFSACVINSSNTDSRIHIGPNVTLVGPTLTQTRDATICNGAQSNNPETGFVTTNKSAGTGIGGNGIEGATIINFGRGVLLRAAHDYVKNAHFVDPINEAAEIASSTATDGIDFSGNEIITTTSGAMSGSIVELINATNVKVNNNQLVANGNGTYFSSFIKSTNAGTTGVAFLNTAPSGETVVNVNASALVTDTGTGAVVHATSPTFVTPILGTPTSGVATNLTGTAAGLTAGNVTTNANLTGDVTSVGNAATVAKINGATLGTTTASSGNLLIGSGSQWATQAITGDCTITSAGVINCTTQDGAIPATKGAVRAATTANLTASYLAGVLTNTGTLAAFSVDGVSASSGDRILVKNQSTAANNGCYNVTTVGSGAVAWVLTRCTDYDTSAEIKEGDTFYVEEGTTLAETGWIMTTSGTVTVGSTSIAFAQSVAASQTVTLTGDVTASGQTGTSISATIAANAVTLAKLATQATNTVLGNATSGTAVPTALAVGTCSTAGSALNWTTNTGFGCNTSITAAAVPASGITGATLASGVTASSLTSFGTSPSLTTPILSGGVFASKPGSPSTGQAYFATDLGTGVMIIYDGTKWKPLGGRAVIYQSGANFPSSPTSSLTEVVGTTVTVPGGLLSANGALHLYALGTGTGGNGTKTFNIRYGVNSASTSDGLAYTNAFAATGLSMQMERYIYNKNSVSSQVTIFSGNSWTGSSTTGSTTASINTASTTYLNFNLLVANAGDTLVYSGITVEWLEP